MTGNGDASRQLRFAVACCDGALQRWQQRCVDLLFDGAGAAWVALIQTAGTALTPRPAPVFGVGDAQRCAPAQTGRHVPLRVAAADTARLAALKLDVVLCFDEQPAPMLTDASVIRGVWHFRFGEKSKSGEPICYWECFAGEPVVAMSLLETSRESTAVLRNGFVAVSATSLTTSVDRALGEAATWPALACAQLFNVAVELARPWRSTIKVDRSIKVSSRRASAAWSLLLAAKLVGRRAARVLDVFFADKWNVGIARCKIEDFLHGAPSRIEWRAEAPALDYRADPFGAAVGSRAWALVEYYDARAARGRIEASAIDGGAWTDDGTDVMPSAAHMSYPFLLQHEGEVYCVPETLGQHAVLLYRAVGTPLHWEKTATLLEGFDAVDATLASHDGRWWLFCTDLQEPRHHRLHVFYSDDLAGPYLPHAANPVKIDPRSAGCAGTPFDVNGTLYRPSQDCSRTYGGRIVINKVVELAPDTFREEVAAIVEPQVPYAQGVHTMSAVGDVTLVDGKRRSLTLRRVLWRLSRPVRRWRASEP